MRVLVTGGTGTIGSHVVPSLLERDVTVRVLTHSPEKKDSIPDGAEVAEGDLLDRGSLAKALEGVDRLFLLTPVSRDETEMGENALAAAADAGVERVVFQSVHRADEGRHIPHFGSKVEIARMLAGSGIPNTVIEPNNFFQNDEFVAEPILEQHVYPHPIGGVGCSRVDAGDIAHCVATALLDDGHVGKSVPVVGPDVLTGENVAARYSEALGDEVAYMGDDLDAWGDAASDTMPGWMVEDMRTMYAWIQDQGFRATDADHGRMAELLGREPRPFTDYVDEAVARWAREG